MKWFELWKIMNGDMIPTHNVIIIAYLWPSTGRIYIWSIYMFLGESILACFKSFLINSNIFKFILEYIIQVGR